MKPIRAIPEHADTIAALPAWQRPYFIPHPAQESEPCKYRLSYSGGIVRYANAGSMAAYGPSDCYAMLWGCPVGWGKEEGEANG